MIGKNGGLLLEEVAEFFILEKFCIAIQLGMAAVSMPMKMRSQYAGWLGCTS
jgi:hypothetical protein